MSEQFLGEIRLFAGNYAPTGWEFCHGQLLSISENDALFALIGTIYGGDGQTTFALPDLRGRLPVGQGAGPNLTLRVMGQQFGQGTVTLSAQQMPAHKHDFFATTAAAESASPSGALLANAGDDQLYVTSPEGPDLKTMSPETVKESGSGQPHDNIMPSLAINYIISLVGVFPSRS